MHPTAIVPTDFTTRREFLARAVATIPLLAGTTNRTIGDDKAAKYDVRPRHSGKRPRIAALYTVLRDKSHAFHILKSNMGPFLFNGQLTDPGIDLVSFYCDQYPDNDMTREAAFRLGMPMYDTVEAALTCGTDRLAVDGVLIIGEHGDYSKSPLGQIMYPRKEFFDRSVAVMDQANRYVPIFNDKHLSYSWELGKQMYDTAREKGIPLMAGSSVPLAQRRPDVDIPLESEVVEAVSIHGGPIESYDFHGFELLQSIVERRKGGETGLTALRWLTAEQMLEAAKRGEWSLELAAAAMQAELGPDFNVISLDGPQALRHGLILEYADGLKGVILSVTGGGNRWNVACRLKNQAEPVAINFFPGPWGNRNLFRALCHSIQEFFITGRSPYPLDRTLLATGVVDASFKSHVANGQRVETPHLRFAYAYEDFASMREYGKSWEIITQDTPITPQFERGDIPTLERMGAH